MCFSAEASFVASGALMGVGIFTVHRTIKSGDSAFLPFALIPWLFGFQQFCEGFVWIFLREHNTAALNAFAFAFLFFALFLWPFYIPLALSIYDAAKRKIFVVLSVLGCMLGLFLYVPYLLDPSALSLKIVDHSICYFISTPWTSPISAIFYLILTVGSMLLASKTQIKILGIITGIAAIIAYYFYAIAFISVWCFFSAIVSVYIGYIAYAARKRVR